jgi:hypothetical protein
MSIDTATLPNVARADWSAIHRAMNSHYLRRFEIPLEDFVSLPAPTFLDGRPAFAFYCCPMKRQPDTAAMAGAITRTWAIAAEGGRLLSFNWLTAKTAPAVRAGIVKMASAEDTVDSVLERLEAFAPIMDQAAAAFFDRQLARQGPLLLQEFERTTGAVFTPYYRSIAPDFFAWLEGGPAASEPKQH